MNPVLTAISAPGPKVPDPREKLSAASKHFEAIFVRQMLAEARKSHFGGADLLGGEGINTFRQMQDERFADIAAERGAFGLAKMIEAQLAVQVGGGAGAAPGASTSSARAGLGFEIKTASHSKNPAQPEPVEGRAQPSAKVR